MCCMFYTCISLKEINLSDFSAYNVVDMSLMFGACTSLKIVELSNLLLIN